MCFAINKKFFRDVTINKSRPSCIFEVFPVSISDMDALCYQSFLFIINQQLFSYLLYAHILFLECYFFVFYQTEIALL